MIKGKATRVYSMNWKKFEEGVKELRVLVEKYEGWIEEHKKEKEIEGGKG